MKTEPPSAPDVVLQLDRLLASPSFARNERMSRFLRFVVEEYLAGREHQLKESVIAVQVFGRKPDYDPKHDSIVRTEAGRLRGRLAEYYTGVGRGDRIVIDLPKGGYVPACRWCADAGAGLPRAAEVPGRRTRGAVAATLLVVAAVIAAVAGLGVRRGPFTVAVMPLEVVDDVSGDAEFADGLTGEIIRNLAAIEGLVVRSRTSSFAFRGRARDVRTVGDQLDVDYVVEGSVLRDGGRLRITAQLIRVDDDTPIWTGRFDREAADVFAIQDEISRGIVNELRLSLGRGRWRYETSVEAYDLYLRARARGADLGMRYVWDSIPLFEEAVARDPAFAPAHAELGARYAIRSVQYPVDHPFDELDRMRAAARRAVELDPLLAASHTAVALAAARDGHWERAERAFRRAITLDPNHAPTRQYFAMWLLNVLGRNGEALQQLRAAERSDPLSAEVHVALAWVLLSLRQPEAAAPYCERLPEANTLRRLCLGRVLIGRGQREEAARFLGGDPQLARQPHTRGFLGYLLGRLGRPADAAALVGANEPHTDALVAAGLGDPDRAFAALERMGTLGPLRVGQFLSYPELRSLPNDHRMAALRLRVGLPN